MRATVSISFRPPFAPAPAYSALWNYWRRRPAPCALRPDLSAPCPRRHADARPARAKCREGKRPAARYPIHRLDHQESEELLGNGSKDWSKNYTELDTSRPEPQDSFSELC